MKACLAKLLAFESWISPLLYEALTLFQLLSSLQPQFSWPYLSSIFCEVKYLKKIPADVNPRKACPHTVFWSLKRPILSCSTNQARRKLTERPARFLPYLVPLAWNGLYWFPIQVGIAPRKPTEIPEQRGQSRLSLFLSFISFVLLDRTVSSRTAWFGDWCSSKLLCLIDSLIKRMKTCSA